MTIIYRSEHPNHTHGLYFPLISLQKSVSLKKNTYFFAIFEFCYMIYIIHRMEYLYQVNISHSSEVLSSSLLHTRLQLSVVRQLIQDPRKKHKLHKQIVVSHTEFSRYSYEISTKYRIVHTGTMKCV